MAISATRAFRSTTEPLRLEYDAANYVSFGVTSTGALKLSPAGTERLRINTSGNVGIGTTDIEAWSSNYRALELGAHSVLFGRNDTASSAGTLLATNAYIDGTGWKYKFTKPATHVQVGQGAIAFAVAPSGTAATAITWTTALTINSAGLLIPNLPTTKPATAGALWNNAGVVNVA